MRRLYIPLLCWVESGDIGRTLDVVGTAEGAEIRSDDRPVVSAMQPAGQLDIAR